MFTISTPCSFQCLNPKWPPLPAAVLRSTQYVSGFYLSASIKASYTCSFRSTMRTGWVIIPTVVVKITDADRFVECPFRRRQGRIFVPAALPFLWDFHDFRTRSDIFLWVWIPTATHVLLAVLQTIQYVSYFHSTASIKIVRWRSQRCQPTGWSYFCLASITDIYAHHIEQFLFWRKQGVLIHSPGVTRWDFHDFHTTHRHHPVSESLPPPLISAPNHSVSRYLVST